MEPCAMAIVKTDPGSGMKNTQKSNVKSTSKVSNTVATTIEKS